MMGLLKRKSEKEKLQSKYEKLIAESYKLSHTDRKASDLKAAEANEILRKIESLN
ncbi:MAG: Lacal_2735 family protein [Roseivirga sp.]|nr:Lacal_2735 family protein [Roseivirga sp.]MBO6659450.1 Lacal_2735 family protein [Roseivirga sp.]MBO6759636.1 Lacal_2735 family protein [Roseivirga sp.]MBO6907813.1 Lacal_2735 family protein [Roseivirga sp.]